MKRSHPFETAILLVVVIAGFAAHTGCTTQSDCSTDADCATGERCSSSGGILWDAKVCIPEDFDEPRDAGADVDGNPDVPPPNHDPNQNNDDPPLNDPDGEVPGNPPVPGEDPGWVGGRSVELRPIIVEHYGEDGPVLFVLSATHGDERLAVTYGERFRTELNAGFAEDQGIQVVFIQSGNPDGVADYSPYNANGINLNRNYPASNYQPGGPAGETALSEPETEAIRDAVDASGMSAVVTLRCCVPGFDHDGPAELLAEAMSEAMGHEFGVVSLGASPGSLGSYVGLDMERPIVTAMFDVAEDTDPFDQLDLMELSFEAAAQWTKNNQVFDGGIDFDDMTTEDEWSYRSSYVGTSAGGRPLRMESVGGDEEAHFLLVSGLDGEERLGAWTAEHIRRELLARPKLDAGFWHFVTAANPDGLAAGDALNDDGDDVEAAIIDMDTSVPEVDALMSVAMDLLGETATIFLVGNSVDDTDRVYITGPESDELAAYIPEEFSTSSPPENTELADGLADAGVSVVQIAVGTETLEAQSDDGLIYPSPVAFSDMVLQMAGLL